MSATDVPTIIAACDGAERGRQAVALGHVVAQATGARLLIAAVYPHPGLPFPPPVGHHVDERTRADRAIRAVRDEMAPGSRTVVVAGLSPAHALCKLAESERARMIVVGSRHAAAGRHMGDADHALQVLRSAHAAVLVAPDDHPVSPTLRRIVVGFDEGAGSHDALAWGIELARSAGAHLHLISVVPQAASTWWVAGDAPIDPMSVDRWVEDREEGLAEAARAGLADAGDIATSFEVVPGTPTRELLRAADGADLLVVGSRRWATLAHLALGSVSEPVVRHSACPTLVVPRRHRGSGAGEQALAAAGLRPAASPTI